MADMPLENTAALSPPSHSASRSSSTSRFGLLKREYTRPGAWPGGGCSPSRGVVEEILAVLRVAEDERGREEDRRLERAFGQGGIESIAHHLRFGRQHAVADLALVIAVDAHRELLEIQLPRSYLDNLAADEYFVVGIDFELQDRRTPDEFALADFEIAAAADVPWR